MPALYSYNEFDWIQYDRLIEEFTDSLTAVGDA